MRMDAKQRGLTLIELMVSLVIGMFLILGAVTVYSQGRQNYQANEGIARLQENMRFALDVLEPDIRLAGYWGMHADAAMINTAGMVVTCDATDVTAWALNPGVGGGPVAFNVRNNVPAGNDLITAGCPANPGGGITDFTDVLEVRRATAQPTALNAGQLQIQNNVSGSVLFNDGNIPAAYSTVNPNQMSTHDVVINAWYVSDSSNGFADVPSLRRRTLRNGVMVDEEVIAGVENMQIQLGIDTDFIRDGNVDRYVEADDPLVATSDVLAMRIWLLVRTPGEERGFQDVRDIVPLDSALDPIAVDDSFRRMEISKTIMVRN